MDGQTPQVGDKLWCVLPDLEAYGYGDRAPRYPWLGVVTRVTGSYIEISRADANGKPDRDSNATAGCDSADEYAQDEATAWGLWKKAMEGHIARLDGDLRHAQRVLQEHETARQVQEVMGVPGKS